MSEPRIVDLVTVARIVLVGGIFAIVPLITRKGLLFGAYVGEAFAEREEARSLKRRWYLACAVIVGFSLMLGLGISAAGHAVAGNLTATATLLIGCAVFYLRSYHDARAMAPPQAAAQAALAVAALDDRDPKGATLAKVSLAICLLAGLATVVYSTIHFDATVDRSAVLAVPLMNLVVSPFLALFALLTARAKRSIRGGSGGHSIEAQNTFRASIANLLSGVALFTCALLTYLSVEIVRTRGSEQGSAWIGVVVFSVLFVLFVLGALIRIIVKYGQGGALIEQGSPDAPLTNGLADDTRWVWGVLYVNRDDPSIMVEKRWGIGYTLNLGNPKAVALIGVFFLLLLGVVGLTLLGAPR